MGYQRKEIQILGGSLNLLPPVDKVPITDYLLAQNWRVDRLGRLVTRFGYSLKGRYLGAAFAHSAAIYGGVEGNWYVGANLPGNNGGGIYFGGATYTHIASGYDGNRVGMVPFNGSMYFMNQGAQGKHSPALGYQPWTVLSPPTTKLTAAAGTADATGPNGTYQFYVTFETTDYSQETNPGPVSAPVVLAYQDVILTNIPISSAANVGIRNIYATGGTLGQPYLIGTINDNTTTSAAFNLPDQTARAGAALLAPWNDLSATDEGTVMPIDNDPPPPAAGMVGPYFSRLIAFNTLANPNRLWWTNPDEVYWPGAADPAIGNWVDVGADGEAIVWCTMHTNVLVIYKERSIWRLVGDPDTGTLEQVVDGLGLVSAFAVTPAGQHDYFVAPNGLYKFDIDRAIDITDPLRPLFDTTYANAGPLTRLGSLAPGPNYFSNSLNCYGVALGYAMGKLYMAFVENTAAPTATNSPILVMHEATGKWFYHRTQSDGGNLVGFKGFIFDGVNMVGLTGDGNVGSNFYLLSLDDFQGHYTLDYNALLPTSPSPIECVWQSHFEDVGQPDNQKNWLEVVIDWEPAGDSATVWVAYDNGNLPLASIGALPAANGRTQVSFPLSQDGQLAKNISVAIDCQSTAGVIVHNVYLYYYEEARLAKSASTIPLDLGSPKVKQCKELQLDIDPSQGPVSVNLYSDLPNNQLRVQHTITVPQGYGRAPLKFPFAVTEGYLWRVALTASTASPFRLYAARLLMRVVGVYVEAYESAAGFVWDSMEHSFESAITRIPRSFAVALSAVPIKRYRTVSLEIETFGGSVAYSFLTDLPGNAQANRQAGSINTGGAGRRFVHIPLPQGTNPEIEGRMCRLQLYGTSKFILYSAAVELLPVGIYIEAYEAAGGAVYDSRQQDGGSPAVKECRELELDIETTGSVTVQLLSDISPTQTFTVSTVGRQKAMLPLTVNAATEQFVEGRLLQLVISGANAFRLYDARIHARAFGQYLQAAETSGGALWDTTDIDLGNPTAKQFREVDLDIWAYAPFTVTVYCDLPTNSMTAQFTQSQAATVGRTKVHIPLQQGAVPDNYIFGRLVRVTVTSSGAFKLFGARIQHRPIGVYIESYEATANPAAVWDSTPADLGSPADKIFDQVRFEMDSDRTSQVAVYTDLPGEVFTSKGTYPLTTAASSRHWVNVPLPANTEGRSIRLIVSGTGGFRIYKAQVRNFKVGRYLAAAAPAGNDALTTLEFDFASERAKMYKRIEVDIRADQAVTFTVLTSQGGGAMNQQYSISLTSNGRQAEVITMPPGVRGRLFRIQIAGGPARIYHLRVWTRPLNEPDALWKWEEYPLEPSEPLPSWIDLPVEATPPAFASFELPVPPTPTEWQWAPFPVGPTPPSQVNDPAQWIWGKFLSVEETPDIWQWVDVPFEVQGK